MTFVEYLQSGGSSYFDTGVIPDVNTFAEMKYSVSELNSHMLSNGDWYFPFPRHDGFLCYCLGTEKSVSTSAINTIYTVKAYSNNKFYINDVEYDISMGSRTSSKTLYMFTYGGSPGSTTYTNQCRVYYCKIWQSGTLVRDFVPVIWGDGVAGMYDKVNGVFYKSITTTEFTAGPEIDVDIEYDPATITVSKGDGYMLYNGVKLPNNVSAIINAYRDTHPYAWLNIGTNYDAWLCMSSTPLIYGTYKTSYTNTYIRIPAKSTFSYLNLTITDGVCGSIKTKTYDKSSETSDSYITWDSGNVFWASYDIDNVDNSTIFLASSDPIPLDGMNIIEWDGNMGGLPNPMSDYYYRVSDVVPSVDEMTNCIVAYRDGSQVENEIFAVPYNNGYYIRPSTDGSEENSSNAVYVVHKTDDIFVKKGLYFYNKNIYNSNSTKNTYATLLAYTTTAPVHAIDTKSFCMGLLYELSGQTLKLGGG